MCNLMQIKYANFFRFIHINLFHNLSNFELSIIDLTFTHEKA